ncbi:flagellar brake protein [Dasania marina]|uniref:flagellar brake protein n=1 Tax=Dasania marina TaxID=471499 RepID=UPI00036B9D06|nr:flagellar brake protein [Dasania marina]
MLKQLKQLLAWLIGHQPNASTLSHYARLQQLCNSHQAVSIKLKLQAADYQSLILHIDQEQHELLIDDLFPTPAQTLKPGTTIQLISYSVGQQLNFYTRVIQRHNNRGNISYLLELPKELGHNHNRNSYRVYVDSERDLRIRLNDVEPAMQSVRISNISNKGIKLYFSDNVQTLLSNIRYLDDVVIILPSGYSIDCRIRIINNYLIQAGHPHSVVGGELMINKPLHKNKLQQYIASVQRQQRKRENRDY